MNSKARAARRIIAQRSKATRAARRPHTMASHALRAGLDASTASSVGGALRSKARQLGTECGRALVSRTVKGQINRKAPKKVCYRYDMAALTEVLAAYNPRAARFVEARATMLVYTAS